MRDVTFKMTFIDFCGSSLTGSKIDKWTEYGVRQYILTPATIDMHISSVITMPPPFFNIKQNRETTRAPIAGPSLNLSTVTAHGSTASTEPTHLELVGEKSIK